MNHPNTILDETGFKSLQILFMALMGGAILMATLMGFLISTEGEVKESTNWLEGFPLYAILLMAAEVVASYFLWNMRQSKLPDAGASAADKLAHYRSACILRWACLQGAVLVSIIFAFLDRNPMIFAVSAVGLALLFLARPSKDYFSEKYGVIAL